MTNATSTTRTAKSSDCERDHSEVSWQATDDLAGADERMASYCVTCNGVFLDAPRTEPVTMKVKPLGAMVIADALKQAGVANDDVASQARQAMITGKVVKVLVQAADVADLRTALKRFSRFGMSHSESLARQSMVKQLS